ncbi:MAG: hypothetical protein BKP49_06200 [Treponema sp. CETP13]|nr:MAG: hypothetical protein BKP49_06200 [Treponema sp. CETP13]
MKSEQFIRTEKLIGSISQKKIQESTIAVFGLGGVGSFTVEALARAGIGTIIIIDNDTINESNINRQLFATHSTVGKLKIDIARMRILDINPNCIVKAYPVFYKPEETNITNTLNKDLAQCSYIIDAIDTVSSKLKLYETAQNLNIPIISCMGTGNKLDATKFCISDIYKTSVCPLARVIRRECKKRRIKHLKVLYSTETPRTSIIKNDQEESRKIAPASISFVPSVAGLLLAGEVIKEIISKD